MLFRTGYWHHISLHVPLSNPPGYPPSLIFTPGQISRHNAELYIAHNYNVVLVAWKSKSGKIYSMDDQYIDCDDIEFWLEGLDPILVYKQLHPKESLPFRLKNLTYELVIHRLNMQMEMRLWLNEGIDPESLLEEIYSYIDKYNMKSIKADRAHGVVHSSQGRVEDRRLILLVDTGSAGSWFLKAFLKYLSGTKMFSKVEIGEDAAC